MDPTADTSNPPPSGANPDEPDTSQMKAVPARPAQPDVVWPEDPFESDVQAAEEPGDAGREVPSPAIPVWAESQFGRPAPPPAHQPVTPLEDDPHTTPFPAQMPTASWSQRAGMESSAAKTQPPAPAKTVPPAQQDGADEGTPAIPSSEVADTAPPASTPVVLETEPPKVEEPEQPAKTEETEEPAGAEAAQETAKAEELEERAPAEETEEVTKPEEPEEAPSEPVVAVAAADEKAEGEPEAVEAPEPAEPAAQPEPGPGPEPLPVEAAEPEPEPAPEPTGAGAPQPAAPSPSEQERLAAEAAAAFAASSSRPPAANPEVPSWAPRFDISKPAGEQVAQAASSLPSWAPAAGGRPTAEPQPVQVTSTPQPAAPAPAAQPAAPQPAHPTAPAPSPAASKPPTPGASAPPKPSSSWEIVPPKGEAQPVNQGPTAEDKSYAEWFAWAKRSGAPASACHAAAQGAFRALSSGQDMATAVKWATVAMASPPGLVGQSRQLYCAWFSLGNIDLQLPTAQAHTFATAAIQALDSGADSMVAHQIGLQAAGIAPR